MAAPLFHLHDVLVTYSVTRALSIPDLILEEGRTYAVVGPNGAGKSTFIRLLNFLEKPQQGEILYRSRPVTGNGTAAVRHEMASLLQPPFLWNATVYTNVAYGLRVRGVDKRVVATAVAEALGRVGLAGFERRRARHLSAGEGQRVALARAVAPAPDVLLLDEPLAHVDAEHSEQVLAVMAQPRLDGPRPTVIFSTHDLAHVRGVADEVFFLRSGEIVSGPCENFFRGEARSEAGRTVIRAGRLTVVAATEQKGTVYMSIDPRDILLSRAPLTSSARNSLAGTVVGIERRERETRVHVDVGEALVAVITEASADALGLAPGTPVYATFKSSAVQVV